MMMRIRTGRRIRLGILCLVGDVRSSGKVEGERQDQEEGGTGRRERGTKTERDRDTSESQTDAAESCLKGDFEAPQRGRRCLNGMQPPLEHLCSNTS